MTQGCACQSHLLVTAAVIVTTKPKTLQPRSRGKRKDRELGNANLWAEVLLLLMRSFKRKLLLRDISGYERKSARAFFRFFSLVLSNFCFGMGWGISSAEDKHERVEGNITDTEALISLLLPLESCQFQSGETETLLSC